MAVLAVYFLSALLFLIILICLGAQPAIIRRLNGALLFIIAAVGTAFYGYGFFSLYGAVLPAAVRTLFAVFCMFLGRNEIGAVSSVPPLNAPWLQVATYLIHLLALYCTASAVVAAIGARIVRTLNLLLLRRGKLHLIFGTDENTVLFAESLLREDGGKVVFIDTGSGGGLEGRIMQLGGLSFSDAGARSPDIRLLRRLGLTSKKRSFHLFALHRDPEENLRYAEAMRDALREAEIPPELTALTAILPEEGSGLHLLVSGGTEGPYGFGNVRSWERHALAARLMVNRFPPFRTMTFDESGRAREDFTALIVGFGGTGQAVLRSLAMNGQFTGSRFRALVAAKGYSQQAGKLLYRFPGLLEFCDIQFLDADGRSGELFKRLSELGPRLKYAALCTGSEAENGEIAREYSRLFPALGIHAPIVQCTPNGIVRLSDGSEPTVRLDLFTPEILLGDKLDRLARILNHNYHRAQGRTAEEDWRECDYFSRESCRASADFMDAILSAAGFDRERALREGFHPEGEVLENLSIMEHRRWCAFHYAMGYRAMPREVWEERARRYREEVRSRGASSLRVGKDTQNLLHACLIPWEELDELSAREQALTGRPVDYKQADRDNVLLIPELLREER